MKNFSCLDALSKSRVGPPLSPIGKRVCTGGFICLGAAFSGLPILTPIEVECLGRIIISELLDINSITDFDLSSSIGFLKSKL